MKIVKQKVFHLNLIKIEKYINNNYIININEF